MRTVTQETVVNGEVIAPVTRTVSIPGEIVAHVAHVFGHA